jgi:hypothetical protein
MIFVIDFLKYDTNKMKLISDKCDYRYTLVNPLFEYGLTCLAIDVKLWMSNKGRYLLTYRKQGIWCAKSLEEDEVKSLLLKYDLSKYEELFGRLEEG